MKKTVIFGLKVSALYTVSVIILTLFIFWLGSSYKQQPDEQILRPLDFVVKGIGLILSFIFGAGFNLVLKRNIEMMTDKEDDLPQDYLKSLCKCKLTYKFSALVSFLCLTSVAAIFPIRDNHPEVMVLLLGFGMSSLFLCISSRKYFRRLRHSRFNYLYDSLLKR